MPPYARSATDSGVGSESFVMPSAAATRAPDKEGPWIFPKYRAPPHLSSLAMMADTSLTTSPQSIPMASSTARARLCPVSR